MTVESIRPVRQKWPPRRGAPAAADASGKSRVQQRMSRAAPCRSGAPPLLPARYLHHRVFAARASPFWCRSDSLKGRVLLRGLMRNITSRNALGFVHVRIGPSARPPCMAFRLAYAGKSCPSSGKSSCGGGKNFTITVLSNNETQ